MIAINKNITDVVLGDLSTSLAKALVIVEVKSFSCLVDLCLSRTNNTGKSKKTIMKIAPILISIIHPKSITGLIPATSNEAKPTIVVIVVNKQGSNLSMSVC